ncbi:OmcA/MtrC family decaheme c-type cytochrome [Aeromonas sp. MdU4]|uniref:OmcA/MtrC family decaheme c-type cytochrome n=1 Tax=Aeromonas sp. MdU4 TaxID=3342819 RepID=UPI0035B8612E
MKYWKALVAAAMVLTLSSCGGGDGSDKNEPPPPPPGTPGSLTISAKAPILDTTLKASTSKLSVEFQVTDKQGKGYDLGAIQPSFTLNKLIPGRDPSREDPTLWKSFIYKPDKQGAIKATGESSGTLEALGNGQYRYTFAVDPTNVTDPYLADSANNGGLISWDETATHRLGIYFGGSNEVPVTNYVLDWVPAGGAPALTRNIVEQSSCDGCHMKQPIHNKPPYHSTFADPKLCVACHNESNPNTTRRSLATIVHKYHGPRKDAADTDTVSHYPQDPRNCDTCHKDATPSTPNAGDWQHAQEKPCGACHADSNSATGFDAHITGKMTSAQTCSSSSCHTTDPANPKSAHAVHMGRLANEAAGQEKLKFTFNDVRYAAPNIEVDLSVTVNGVPAETFHDVAKFVKNDNAKAPQDDDGAPAILINWDQGNGFELATTNPQTYATGNTIKLSGCTAQGGGRFLCSKEVGNEVNGTLAATISDVRACVARKADRNGAFAAGDLVPCSTASGLSAVVINPVKAYFRAEGGIDSNYVLKSGSDMAACNSCHKDLTAHLTVHPTKDMSQCTSCHNATRTAFNPGVPGDLKYHVHSYHQVGSEHGGTPSKPFISHFPGKGNNCESCHTKAQYNLPNQQNARPSLAATTTDNKLPKYFSPTLVVCSSCHLKSPLGLVKPDSPVAGDEWATHMKNNGAVFGAETSEAATGVEQCASCHAVGMDQGVDKVHKVYDFR